MLTPEDVRRLVKNRNAREHRAQLREDLAEEEQLDYIEEAIAEYLAGEEYLDYITNIIDDAVQQAVAEDLPIYIGFAQKSPDDYSCVSAVSNNYHIDRRSKYEKAWSVVMSVASIGIEDREAVVEALAETILALYQDAGWQTSENVVGQTVCIPSEHQIVAFECTVWTRGFWLYY